MATYRTTIESAWSQPDAFEYLATFSNAREWDPSVAEAEALTAGAAALGSQYRLAVRVAGRLVRFLYEVVAIDRPARVVLQANRRFLSSTDTITVDPAPAGSVVRYVAVLDLRGPSRLLRPLVSPLLERRFAALADAAAAGLRAALA